MQPEEHEEVKDKQDVRQGEVRGVRWILIISFSLSAIALAAILLFFVI